MLYIRTFVTIAIALYTSRIVLSALGESDFGIYTIVGGVVVLFSFLQGAMASATQRFLNFEMGSGDKASVSRIFSMSMTAHISIALVVLILAETVGLWFITTQLNIPPDRHYAMHWVYQLSVLTTCVSIVRIPYHATIVAHERMGFYAYISIVESILSLVVVYILLFSNSDRLMLYALLVLLVRIIVTLIYKVYCGMKFKTTRYRFFWDSALYRKLMSFSGWSLLGASTTAASSQGVNVILNIFFGVLVNAAMGIANQVQSAVLAFSSNFQTAFNPQLVRSYAVGDIDYFKKLIYQTSRYSFLLIYIIAMPMFVYADEVLAIWLGEVPEYSVQFTKLVLCFIVVEAISTPLWTAVQAVGKIRNYQIIISSIILLNIPIVFVLLELGYNPMWAVAVRPVVALFAYIFRVVYLMKIIKLSLREYMLRVVYVCISVTVVSLLLIYILCSFWTDYLDTIYTLPITLVVIFTVIYLLGLSRGDRELVNGKIKNLTKK